MQLTVNLGTDSRYHSVRSRWILDNFATFSCWETRITFQWFICRLYFFWGDELCNGSKISSECAIEPQYTLIIIFLFLASPYLSLFSKTRSYLHQNKCLLHLHLYSVEMTQMFHQLEVQNSDTNQTKKSESTRTKGIVDPMVQRRVYSFLLTFMICRRQWRRLAERRRERIMIKS